MKKVLLAALIIFLIAASGVYATKTIVYISQQDCYELPCTCYSETSNDRYYCSELETWYNVVKLKDVEVQQNRPIWQTESAAADMIFLGDISQDMIETDIFCNYIEDAIIPNERQIFSTGMNNYYNYPSISGCVFQLGFVTYPATAGLENTYYVDESTAFYTVDHAITQGIDSPVNLYKENAVTYLHNSAGDGQVRIRDQPVGLATYDFYPVVDMGIGSGKAVFWGLNNTTSFTADARTIFDNAVLLTMGDLQFGEIIGVLTTNQDIYKPGKYVNITFEPESDIDSVEITFIHPDGVEYVLGDTDEHWNLNYTTGTGLANGTYTITATVRAAAATNDFTKKIDIIPYNLFSTADGYSYLHGEDVEITINILDVYDPNLNMTANIDIYNPNSNKTDFFYGNIPHSFNRSYYINGDLVGGKYTIKIELNDSDDREIYNELEFVVRSAGNVTVSPQVWNIVTSTSGEKSQLFTINNTGEANISTISMSTRGDLNITLDKNSISSIAIHEIMNFTATVDADTVGVTTGEIVLGGDINEYVIDVELDYSSAPVQDSLVVTPSSLSVITIAGKSITYDFELENIASADATDIDYNIPDSIGDVVSVISIPNTVDSGDTGDMRIKVDTSGISIDTYSGSLSVESSVGDDSISVNIEVIGNIYDDAEDKLTELIGLRQAIDDLGKKEGVEALNQLYDDIKSDLESAQSEYEDENYELAKSYYQSALSDISRLESDIEDIQMQKSDHGWIIWTVAIIIIIAIIGVIVFRYKDEIIKLINKLMKKETTQEPEEYYPYSEGEYRTEYY